MILLFVAQTGKKIRKKWKKIKPNTHREREKKINFIWGHLVRRVERNKSKTETSNLSHNFLHHFESDEKRASRNQVSSYGTLLNSTDNSHLHLFSFIFFVFALPYQQFIILTCLCCHSLEFLYNFRGLRFACATTYSSPIYWFKIDVSFWWQLTWSWLDVVIEIASSVNQRK